MSMLQQVIAQWPRGHRMPDMSWAATMRASNEELMPPPVALDIDLRGVASSDDARLLAEETRIKLAMLAPDRRVHALLFDGAASTEAVARHRRAACDAVRACLGERDRGLRMLLSAEVRDDSLPLRYESEGQDIEYALTVGADAKPADFANFLATLPRVAAGGHPPARTEVWLREGMDVLGGDDELLQLAADGSDALSLALLATGAAAQQTAHRELYARIVTRLDALGLHRHSPCRYQRSRTRRGCIASLLAHFPQLDVIGIGPGAVSQVQQLRFVNHSSLAAYRAAVDSGADAVDSAWSLNGAELLLAEIASKLLAGVGLHAPSLLDACRSSAPSFTAALRACLEDLQQRGLLSLDLSGRLVLCVAADSQFGALLETLQALLPVSDSANVIPLPSR